MPDTGNQKTYSEALAEFAWGLKFVDIPAHVVAKAKTHLMDSVGVALAGSTTEWWKRANRVCQRLGGPPEAAVFTQPGKIGVSSAAMANSSAIAGLDYDDTDYWGGGGHMSRYVIAAALSVGEMAHRSGKEVLTAIVAGYEVASRVGAALLVDRYGGRAPKATWGAEELAIHERVQRFGGSIRGTTPGLFACAVEAGLLLGLGADRIASAQGLAGGLGIFLAQTHQEGADAMPLHPGWACHGGIVAALWASEGLRGPRLVYEGHKGFLPVVGGEFHDPKRLTEGLGTEWNTLNNVLKFYPSGHGTHHFIESLKAVMQQEGLKAEDVAEVVCVAPSQRVEIHFTPLEAKLNPTPYNGRFSLPYMLACLLVDGELGAQSFTQEKVSDPKVRELARRVTYRLDDTAWLGDKRGLVEVKLNNGRVVTRSTPVLLDFPNRPCSRDDVLGKFKANARLVLTDAKRVDALAEALETVEKAEDIGTVTGLTIP